MAYTGLLKDFIGGGLASALPSAATLGPTIPAGQSAFYFATDTNVLYRLAGGDVVWQIAAAGGGGSLVLLEQHTASNSASLDFTTAITATYDEYQIEFIDLLPATNSVGLNMLMSTNGGSSYDTGANYGYIVKASNRFGDTTAGADSGANALPLIRGGVIANTASTSLSGSCKLFNPGGANYKNVVGNFGYFAGANLELGATNGFYLISTAVNAFRILFTSGNITSGTVRVYGIAKV